MRNKRETDISQYKDIQPEINPAVRKVNPIKRFSRHSVNLFYNFLGMRCCGSYRSYFARNLHCEPCIRTDRH